MRKSFYLCLVILAVFSFCVVKAMAATIGTQVAPAVKSPAPSLNLTNAPYIQFMKGIVIEGCQAWREPGYSSPKWSFVIRNTNQVALTNEIGYFHIFASGLVGSSWQLFGGVPMRPGLEDIGPGGFYERHDLTTVPPNGVVTQFKCVVGGTNMDMLFAASQPVTIQNGRPPQITANAVMGRPVVSNLTFEKFSPYIDATAKSLLEMVIRNNTNMAFTKPNGPIQIKLYGDRDGQWVYHETKIIEEIPAGGAATFHAVPFMDKGNYQLKADIEHFGQTYKSVTAPIANTALRDSLGEKIASNMRIESLVANRLADGSTTFSVIVRNNTPYAFTLSMGQIDVQTYAYTGNSWVASGIWPIYEATGNGTAQITNRKIIGSNQSAVSVQLLYKGKVITQKEVPVQP